jgi:hypothetical protein
MSVRARIEKYRKSGGAADLVRVEVLVPASSRLDILNQASALRIAHRQKNALLKHDLNQAIDRYGLLILDNIDIDSVPDISRKSRIVANALIERGDARAFVIGRKLLEKASG